MNTRSLLFVDDEKDLLDILVDLFADDGYDLHTASSADEAENILEEHPVDFILADLKLPDASGTELLEGAKDKYPEAVRVLTSGYLDVKFGRVAENKLDGTLYLAKPWDLNTIRNLVTEKLS